MSLEQQKEEEELHDAEAAAVMAESDDAIAELQRRGAPSVGRQPLPQPRHAPNEGDCTDCSAGKARQKRFFDAFGLYVCYDCQMQHKGAGCKYQLLSKSKVLQEYLLTDGQLSKAQGGLGCMAITNPSDSRFGDMKLYLRAQVETLALQTWHSEEELLLEKERRRESRLQKAEAKRKAPGGRGDRGGVSGSCDGGSSVDGAKKRRVDPEETRAVLAKLAPPLHVHRFLDENEVYDEATDLWTRRCECGHSETYERM